MASCKRKCDAALPSGRTRATPHPCVARLICCGRRIIPHGVSFRYMYDDVRSRLRVKRILKRANGYCCYVSCAASQSPSESSEVSETHVPFHSTQRQNSMQASSAGGPQAIGRGRPMHRRQAPHCVSSEAHPRVTSAPKSCPFPPALSEEPPAPQ
jgi:hypothetical protein